MDRSRAVFVMIAPLEIGTLALTLTSCRRFAPILVTTGLLSLSLGGCSWFHHKAATAEPPPSCPVVAVLPQLAQASQFLGSGTGYSDVTYTASLSGVSSRCSFERHGILVDASFKLMAQQGPRGQGGTVDFPYFVAILDPAGTVLTKTEFSAPLSLTPLQARTGSKESLHDYVPLDDKAAAGGYSVVIGFQLDDRQIGFNRSTGVGN